MRIIGTVHAEPDSVDDSPNYRVNFWSRPSQDAAFNLDAYVLSEAHSFDEVLHWAKQNQRGRRVEIYVEATAEPLTAFEVPRVARLVRLAGEDPNLGIISEAWTFKASPASDAPTQR
ncbi:MAG: hypothetical protein ACTHXV_09340 [Canibacter sp.]